ncbi:embigin isoform X2 [Girardinichthys multiradiatus]|uniref:embigin isoform X2 n=1 Tax=Girardinichthys multiradiatus TaxID=208333 RepID=UPI001FAC857A|nr:embigin isoform X2 [Girardinichthys multiradiatus]
MQWAHRPSHTEDREITTMTASWKQLPIHILLILASCRHISSKSVGPTAPPLALITTLPTDTRSVVLKGENTFENIELLSPVNISLECTWTGNQNKQPNITGYWRKDGVEIQDSRVTVDLENQQYNLKQVFSIVNEENLGNYTCVFGNVAELVFILAAPQIGEIRDKPIVSYVGDFVVLTCKMEENKPTPNSWNWFKYNGTEKEQISVATEPHRYLISSEGWKTKLKVKNVSEADAGLYYCGAVYAISTSLSHVELKVITILEPLKPFLTILVEVVILVAAILIYERSHSKRKEAEADGPNADPMNTQPQGEENGAEESNSVRQRKA